MASRTIEDLTTLHTIDRITTLAAHYRPAREVMGSGWYGMGGFLFGCDCDRKPDGVDMSIRVMAAVWERSRHKGSALLCLLAIADFADDDGMAFPSIARLADKTRMTTRNVQFILENLVASGEITLTSGRGRHHVNAYVIELEALGKYENFSHFGNAKLGADKHEIQRGENTKPTSHESSVGEPSLESPLSEREVPGYIVKRQAVRP